MSSGFASPYIPNTDLDRQKMLDVIGVESVDDLFKDIPQEQRDPCLDLSKPLSEFELRVELEAMARQNRVPGEYACFLGAGSYRHYIPAVVRQISSRSEYMTSYTPYQPEVSQGTLQAHYEFQTLVCQLTGMDVANSGMYDGSTALAEAALMAVRITKRDRVAVLNTLSPRYQEVLNTYVRAPGVKVDVMDPGSLMLQDGTACIIVQQPNYFGGMESIEVLSERARSQGVLLVIHADPVSLGMFKPPGDYGADIVVAEGQSLGAAPAFGGPYVGMFACKGQYIRQMPGRVVGQTTDTMGRTGYVLTLQTREQHIRRERATSNICTSVGLISLMTTVYMSLLGKQGLRHIAWLCYHKAHYAASLIQRIPGYSLPIPGVFFREFVVQCPMPPAEINERLLDYGIIGGMDVSPYISNGMLLCCTEVNSRGEIEALAKALAEISS